MPFFYTISKKKFNAYNRAEFYLVLTRDFFAYHKEVWFSPLGAVDHSAILKHFCDKSIEISINDQTLCKGSFIHSFMLINYISSNFLQSIQNLFFCNHRDIAVMVRWTWFPFTKASPRQQPFYTIYAQNMYSSCKADFWLPVTAPLPLSRNFRIYQITVNPSEQPLWGHSNDYPLPPPPPRFLHGIFVSHSPPPFFLPP